MAVQDSLITGTVEVADLQRIVPVTIVRSGTRKLSGDIGALASKVVGDTVTDDEGGSDWTVAARVSINPMAKYKPVRNTKKTKLTAADFIASKYGFSDTIPSYGSGIVNPSVTWTYLKPRGSSYNEPYRITDFENYYHLAACPYAFDVSGELDNAIGLTFYVDNMAPTAMGYQGRHWHEETCLSIADFLAGRPQYNEYMCICIHNLDHGGSAVVVTDIQPSSLAASAPSIQLFAEGVTGYNNTAISLLSDRTRSGDTFRIITGICAQAPQNNYHYEVVSGIQDIYSMAFEEGIDRREIQLYVNDSIAGLTATITPTITSSVDRGEVYVAAYGMTMRKFDITFNVAATLVTPQGHWAVDEVGVQVNLMSEHGYVGDQYAVEYQKVPVSCPLNNHTYNATILSAVQVSVYFFHGVPSSAFDIEFSASVWWIWEHIDTNKVTVNL